MTKDASRSLFPTDITFEQWEDALRHLKDLSADDLRSYELVELEGGKKHTLAMVVASKLGGEQNNEALKVLSAMIDKMSYDDLKKQGSDGKTLETVLAERMNGENSQNIRTIYNDLVNKINSKVISDDEMDDFLEANSSEIAEASQNEEVIILGDVDFAASDKSFPEQDREELNHPVVEQTVASKFHDYIEEYRFKSYAEISHNLMPKINADGKKCANPAFYAAAHAGRKDDDGALEFLEALIDKMKLKDIKFKDENGLTLEKILKERHGNGHISDEDFNKLNAKIKEIEEREARLHKILKKTLEHHSKNPSGEAVFVSAVRTSLPNGVEKSEI